MTIPTPCVDGILTPDDVRATAASIRARQQASGAIPWENGQHTDVWNHVEAAMALLAAGDVDAAERALAWVPRHQYDDGSWPAVIVDDEITDGRSETNMSAYFAVGLWHHWLIRRDRRFVESLWPSARAGLNWVVSQQQAFGGIRWTPQDDFCLLAGNSSIYQALHAGVALAELVDEPQPEWELAGGRLSHSLDKHLDLFADKSTFSMDWYYPVLGGAISGAAGVSRLAEKWQHFVIPGLGVRCVDTNPWVTGAETCELVMALDNLGEHAQARQLFAEMQHLRAEDGGYWTGWVYDDPAYPNDNPNAYWPQDHTTFTAAAVILAADALGERYGVATPGSGIMRGTSFGPRFDEIALECGCGSVASGVGLDKLDQQS